MPNRVEIKLAVEYEVHCTAQSHISVEASLLTKGIKLSRAGLQLKHISKETDRSLKTGVIECNMISH